MAKSNNLKSFWSSLPMVLTGVATVISAIGGVLIIFYGGPTVEFFEASPDNIVSGDDATLSWGVSDATYVTINPGVGAVELIGSRTVSPTKTTTYILKAIKEGKSDVATEIVTVGEGHSPDSSPDLSPDPFPFGPDYRKDDWSTNNTTDNTINKSEEVEPDDRIVTPTIESFEANPDNIISGEDVTLSWKVSGAADVTLNPGIGNVNLNGSKIVYPTENITYTLKAANGVESVNSSKTVFVEKPNLGIEFVSIPAGEFMMGSPSDEMGREADEGPLHEVKIEAFELGKYEITQKQWVEIMGSNPSKWIGDNLPVDHVSINDVEEFIESLNERESTDKYRLPTEAEWEYACRAGNTTAYSFGDDESKLGDYAWYKANSGGKFHPVGQKKPNSFGLYDMSGNVWEWVQDDSHNSYDGAPSDGSAWGNGGSSRGGSYYNVAKFCRSANRIRDSHDLEGMIGFRLVREI